MKNVHNILILASVCTLIVSLAACGGSSGGLGRQIDQMGRAAVNTALNNTFTATAVRGAAEDDYNAEDPLSRFRFTSEVAANLAIYDSLAGTCGDNAVTNRASADPADGLATGASRYNFLATVLADDQLYVNASSAGAVGGACAQYLAAELGVIGVTGFGTDCGGRTPNHDVIDVTYSVVAAGGVSGVGDGVAADNVAHSLTVFPFLAPAS